MSRAYRDRARADLFQGQDGPRLSAKDAQIASLMKEVQSLRRRSHPPIKQHVDQINATIAQICNQIQAINVTFERYTQSARQEKQILGQQLKKLHAQRASQLAKKEQLMEEGRRLKREAQAQFRIYKDQFSKVGQLQSQSKHTTQLLTSKLQLSRVAALRQAQQKQAIYRSLAWDISQLDVRVANSTDQLQRLESCSVAAQLQLAKQANDSIAAKVAQLQQELSYRVAGLQEINRASARQSVPLQKLRGILAGNESQISLIILAVEQHKLRQQKMQNELRCWEQRNQQLSQAIANLQSQQRQIQGASELADNRVAKAREQLAKLSRHKSELQRVNAELKETLTLHKREYIALAQSLWGLAGVVGRLTGNGLGRGRSRPRA